MLNSHAEAFPEAVSVFNFMYGVDAPVFMLDEHLNIDIVWSSEGPRQGCAAGTYLFCTGIVSLVSQLQALYPDFTLLVLTDDINALLPPPDTDTPDNWQKLYVRYAAFLADLARLSKELAGLNLNVDKCGILLPPGAPPPTEETRAVFPTGFDFRVDGFRIAGSPIGTQDFMENFVQKKLAEAVSKLQAIKSLGSKCARATHRLLVTCGTKLLSFLASTVPPSVMMPVLASFDKHVDSVFFGTICSNLNCSEERFDRARTRACLPAPFGCSLFRAADQGRAAWLSSVAACLSDPLLFRLRSGLTQFVEPAWTLLVDALGGVGSTYWSHVAHLLPSTAAGFLDGSIFSPSNDGKIKISKVVLKLLSRIRTEKFSASTSVEQIGATLTAPDVLRANAQSLAGRIFTTPLKFHTPFAFTNEQYLAWCRSFLALPPGTTIGNHSEQEGFDYPVQKCLALHNCKSPFLDADGCHAAARCPATYAGRMKKHNYLIRVLARAAREAGLRVKEEPDTYGLLLGEFSKAECRRIFPKHVSKPYRDKFNEVLNAIDMVASPACHMDDTAKHAYVQARIDALPAVKRDDATGLRIDISIENEDTGETKWVDVTTVHTGAESYRDKELKAVASRQIANKIAGSLSVPDPLKSDPSPLLLERQTAKHEKYSRLLLVAKKQAAEKKRKQVPTFFTFAVSDYGEVAPLAADLQEWLVTQFWSQCEKSGKRLDGCKVLDLVRDFRYRLRIGIQLAVAAGCGEMISKAGRAWG